MILPAWFQLSYAAFVLVGSGAIVCAASYRSIVGGRRSRDIALSALRRWELMTDHAILHREPRRFGPFRFWFGGRPGRRVFRVVARDRAGKIRSGWMLCGGSNHGDRGSRRIKVRWDVDAAGFETRAQLPPAIPEDDPLWDEWIDR